MHGKTEIRLFKKRAIEFKFKFKLIFVLLLVLLSYFPTSASASQDNDTLINGSGIFLTTGDSWTFYQGYELVFKGISASKGENKVWVELLQNDECVDYSIMCEGEYFEYTHNSKEIFNITVDTIYLSSDGGLVTFNSVYQYLDPTLPKPDMTQGNKISDILNESVNNSAPDDDEIKNVRGFGAGLLFLCVTAAAIIKIRKNKS